MPAEQACAQAAPAMAAPSTAPAQKASDVFVANAPDEYTVVKGDTLWGIAGRFLASPWRWPEIWKMNRDQIKNPHWIYPGQVIILDKTNGTMRLKGASTDSNYVELKPSVRVDSDRDAIPSIPQEAITPFLSQPIIVENATMLTAPRIVAAQHDRVVLTRGDTAYISGVTDTSVRAYQIFRPGTAIKDPDTGAVIAYQATYLGAAQVTRDGDPATITITSFAKEISVGDRLVPASRPVLINYVPHAPAGPVSGRVVAAYDGVAYAGKNMVVVLNRGTASGLEIGNVLALQSRGATIIDRTNGGKGTIKLPDERNGLMFVFRVFDNISYALLLDVSIPVVVGDAFTQP